MEIKKFKTNVNCSGCVAKVTNSLNDSVGAGNWSVDITDTNKILTVSNDQISEEEIIKAVQKTGFKIDSLI